MIPKDPNENKKPQVLSKKILWSYGCGHMLNDLCASMWFSYLLVFFHYAMNLQNSLCGLLLLIGQIADGIATPIIGILSDLGDGHWMCIYGHRKTWHLIGTLCVVLSFPFIFSPCFISSYENININVIIFYYSIFIIIFQFGWAATQVSHLSLVPDLTPNQNERTSLITVRYSFTVLANIMVHLVTYILLYKHRNNTSDMQIVGPQDSQKFQFVALFATAAGSIFSLIFHLGVSERSKLLVYATKGPTEKINKCFVIKQLNLYHIMILYMMTQLFVNQSQVCLPLYLEEYLNVEAQRLPILPLILYLSSSVSSILAQSLNNKLGRKLAYIIGAFIAVLICVVIFYGKNAVIYKEYTIYAVVAVIGCASSIISVSSLGITADLIGEHTSQGAFVYGLMSFADKISNGLVVMLVQYLKHYCPATSYYRDMLILTCGGSAAIGLIFVSLLPKNFKLSYSKNTDNLQTSKP